MLQRPLDERTSRTRSTPPPRPPEDAWQAAPGDSELTPATTHAPETPSFHLTSAERLGLVYSSLGFFVVLVAIALGATIAFSAGFGEWLLTSAAAAVLLVVVNLILNLDLMTTHP